MAWDNDEYNQYIKMRTWDDTSYINISDYSHGGEYARIIPKIYHKTIFHISDHNTLSIISEDSQSDHDLTKYLDGSIASIITVDGTYSEKFFDFFLTRDEDVAEQPFYFRYEDDQLQYMGHLNKSTRSKGILDPMKNVWIASHAGLKRVNPHITYFNDNNVNMVNALHAIVEDSDSTIWLGGYVNGFSTYQDHELTKVENGNDFPKKVLPGGTLIQDGSLLFLTEDVPRFLFIEPDGSWYRKDIVINGNNEKRRIAGYYANHLNNWQLAIGLQHKGLGLVDSMDHESIYVSNIGEEKGVNLTNVLHFTQDNNDRIWMGRTSTGVALYDMELDTAWTFARTGEDTASFGTISGAFDDYGTLWLGSNRGLYCLENASDFDPNEQDFFKEVKFIPLPDGDKRTIASMTIHKDMLYFGGQSALNMLDIKKYHQNPESPWIYQLRYGEDINGGGSEQNTMMIDSKGYLWLGSQQGASKIDIARLPLDTFQTKIKFKNIETGKGELAISDRIRIPTDSRNLSLTFGPKHNPSLMRNTFFDYDLINAQGDTIESGRYDRDGILELNYLPPGSYDFHVVAKKHNQIVDDQTIKIEVPLSLSENPVTWVALMTLFSGGIFTFLFIRNRQRQKIADQELKLSKIQNEKDNLQVQSIISSFNPHFINNSLHWAQSRYRKDPDLTLLLHALSRNIKYIFLKTRQSEPWHTLEKELELVKNYVDIQLLRFNHSFEYVSPDISASQDILLHEVLIMQIQIHVENAIEHGLQKGLHSSYVKVSILEEDNMLTIEVEDDGSGRNRAKKIGSMGTQQGVKMLNDLQKIYNSINKQKMATKYYDDIFIDENNRKYGTRVEIKIPLMIAKKLG